jgi:hypothetical protein
MYNCDNNGSTVLRKRRCYMTIPTYNSSDYVYKIGQSIVQLKHNNANIVLKMCIL